MNSPSRQTSRLLHFQHGCTTLPFLRPSPLRRAQRMPQGGRGKPSPGALGTVQIRFGGALRAKQQGLTLGVQAYWKVTTQALLEGYTWGFSSLTAGVPELYPKNAFGVWNIIM